MRISKDFREFIELLNSNGVDYVIVGAYAVAWHGYPRYTGDLDVLVRPDAANSWRLRTTLVQFGFGELELQPSDFETSDLIVQLGFPPNRIDLLTSISGTSFAEVWESRETGDLDGIAVPFIGRACLIRNKEASARPKDLADAAELRRAGSEP